MNSLTNGISLRQFKPHFEKNKGLRDIIWLFRSERTYGFMLSMETIIQNTPVSESATENTQRDVLQPKLFDPIVHGFSQTLCFNVCRQNT